ncbi:uncharacterized protein LOC122626722 isoform X2 [Drosophila teissieri]|uniref:uncharacterized protein LOC122626722 isoform X2 n=1 Tax=Drosophila teissieri TaxID=7243 RepID=UPI001CBA1070|nr:uncharacterized protein LOC122626722 isoform X2 [Drosophila teissieri]
MCSTSHRHGFISSDLSAVRSPLLFADLFRSTPPPIFLRIIDGHGDRHRHVAQAQCTGTDVQDPLAKKSPPDRKAGSGSANAPPTATGKTMRNKARCH